jgi:protein-arginine kinase activator protein McsA
VKITATLSEKTQAKLGLTNVQPVTVDCNIPASLADKVTLFGEEVINASSEDALVITVQALMRRMMAPKVNKEGKVTSPAATQEQIQAAVDAWRPDVRTLIRQTAFEKATSVLDKLSPEERQAILEKLQTLSEQRAAA